MNKLLVICGPTATGKTSLGIKLAQKYDGEIVSADSRQVYKGMDIISGKDILPNEKLIVKNEKLNIKNKKFTVGFRMKDNIPIWLVDIVEPNYPFNVGEYCILARKTIEDIWQRSKLPIVLGGTGLYIKSIIDPLETMYIPPNKLLRKELESLEITQLQNLLQKTDLSKWEKMNISDRQNPRRLVRAIEIAQWKNSNDDKLVTITSAPIDSLIIIGLSSPKKYLYELIERRINERLKNGAIEEMIRLKKKGYSPFLPAFSATGYQKLSDYLDGINTLLGALQSWKRQECQLARNQMVWFKKDKRICWFDIHDINYIDKIEKTIREWYTTN